MTALDAATAKTRLEAAVDQNDFATFNATYREFLAQYPAFARAYSRTPTDVTVHNAIFGHKCFFLKQTNDTEAASILSGGRAASGVFGKLTVAERLEFLRILEKKIEQHKEAIKLVITADTGKPMDLSEGEMAKGREWFDYAAKEAESQIGPKGPAGNQVSTKPMGVAQIIGAYNYPYALAIGGIVGALAGGNGVVVSAPLKAPNWVFPFMHAVREAAEEFSGKALAADKPWAEAFAKITDKLVQCSVGVNQNLTSGVDVVHFVGGDFVGNLISKARGNKPTILEMGGSNVVVVMKSALLETGIDKGIAKTIYGGFAPATGQRCTAPRMLCVQKGAESVVTELGRLCDDADHRIGNPFRAGTKMGPLVDRGAHQLMTEAIAEAQALGAKAYGKMAVSDNVVPQARNDSSFWVGPVVLDWSNVDMSNAEKAARIDAILKKEIFGPLLHVVHSIDDIGDAVAVTNRLDSHGLAGAIFTGSQAELDHYHDNVSVTSLTVNEMPKDRSPWGPHGHPGHATIGGRNHFNLYCSNAVVVQPKPFVAAEPT